MLNLLLQLQLLLAALSAFLPLAPEEHRVRAAEILDVAVKVLAAGGSIAGNVDDLAVKLAAIPRRGRSDRGKRANRQG